MKINTWAIDRTEDGGEYEANYTADDFDGWWKSGMTDQDRVSDRHERELYDNCKYLAEHEHRRITQSASELRQAIADWANRHNNRIK